MKCSDCRDTGIIQLLTSVVPCGKCQKTKSPLYAEAAVKHGVTPDQAKLLTYAAVYGGSAKMQKQYQEMTGRFPCNKLTYGTLTVIHDEICATRVDVEFRR